MPLTRDFPVEHRVRKDLGRGIVVGSELVPTVDSETNELNHQSLMLVIWENAITPSPSFHSPEDLAHAVDFDHEFEDAGDDDDDDDDDEFNKESLAHDDDEIEEVDYAVADHANVSKEPSQPEVVAP